MGLIESFKKYQKRREEKLFERAELAPIEEERLRKVSTAKAKIQRVKELKAEGRRKLFKKVAKEVSFFSQSIDPLGKSPKRTFSGQKIKSYKPMRIKSYKPRRW